MAPHGLRTLCVPPAAFNNALANVCPLEMMEVLSQDHVPEHNMPAQPSMLTVLLISQSYVSGEEVQKQPDNLRADALLHILASFYIWAIEAIEAADTFSKLLNTYYELWAAEELIAAQLPSLVRLCMASELGEIKRLQYAEAGQHEHSMQGAFSNHQGQQNIVRCLGHVLCHRALQAILLCCARPCRAES